MKVAKMDLGFFYTNILKWNKDNATLSVDSHGLLTLKTFAEQVIWKNDIMNTTESTLDLEERLCGCSRK